MARWLAVDYGRTRIGLALSDPAGTLASPLRTIPGTGSIPSDAERIAAIARQEQADAILVGLPLNMDGTVGPQAQLSRELAARLAKIATHEVRLHDERLSTFAADQRLSAHGLTRKQKKRRRDAIAAQVFLQAFLDGAGRQAKDQPMD
jgi:putative Holliday junction resolvase